MKKHRTHFDVFIISHSEKPKTTLLIKLLHYFKNTMMMMFDNNMNTMDFLSANEAITGKAQSQRINADSNDNADKNRRSSDNSTSEESNNMFTKVSLSLLFDFIISSKYLTFTSHNYLFLVATTNSSPSHSNFIQF